MTTDITYEKLDKYISTEHFTDKDALYLINKDNNLKIITESSLENFLKTGKEKAYQHDDSAYFAIKKEGLDFLKRYGWMISEWLLKMDGNNENKSMTRSNFLKGLTKKDLLSDNKDFVIVETKYNDWGTIWKTNEGDYYLEPLNLTWINANLSNKNYYLDELVEHLSQQDNVAFVTHLDRWDKNDSKLLFTPLTGNEEGIGTIIFDIEHNLEEGDEYPTDETETATLYYFPDHDNKELIQNLVNIANDRDLLDKSNKVFNVATHVLQNILGAKAFLKVPENSAVNKRKFKNY